MTNKNCFLNSFENFDSSVTAVTGGIGCGKTTVVKIFEKLGCKIINTDSICQELYEDDSFKEQLIAHWGKTILKNNKIDKKKIAELVFREKEELSFLNAVTHPLIMEKVKELIATTQYKVEKIITIVEIPLLFESGLDKLFHTSITVWCDRELQYQRIKERNNWSKKEIDARLANQMPSDKKLELASYGIINNGTVETVKEQCKSILLDILRCL